MISGLIAMAMLAGVRQPVDTYGKSNAEMLKMGCAAWYKFYTGHAGDSTAAMSNAYGIYGDVARSRNDDLIAHLSEPKRSHLRSLRKMIIEFNGDMISIGTTVTQGGTLWNTVTEQGGAEAEDTIYALIHPAGQEVPKHLVASDVGKELAKVPGELKDASLAMPKGDQSVSKAMQDWEAAKKLYDQIVLEAANLDRAGSDRVIGFCLESAKLPGSF
jgi:hypothetical protein